MKSYVMGIDFGSTTAKTVILDLSGRIVASSVAHVGAVSGDGVKASVSAALEHFSFRLVRTLRLRNSLRIRVE
jgi:(R)-2-hydroxyacyl-CoA dehydratese activating ATPase